MKPGWYWPYAIGLFLGVVAICDFTMIYVISTHRSFAVEEDYYDKGMEWDKKKKQEQQNELLGWKVEPRLSVTSDVGKRGTQLELELVDKDGRPIEGALVEARCFHYAWPKRVFSGQCVANAPGSYRAFYPSAKLGKWHVELEITYEGDKYVATHSEYSRTGS